jgi:hypothetical protein
MRRGLWVGECVTVHGPHEPPSNHMWGEATATIDGNERWIVDCAFVTTKQVRNKYDVRFLRIINRDDPERLVFRILKRSELTPKARRWLRAARRAQRKL